MSLLFIYDGIRLICVFEDGINRFSHDMVLMLISIENCQGKNSKV